jgi:TPR repeat protein
MRRPWIKALASFALTLILFLTGFQAMAYPQFICAYEKDHNPPLDAEAERWFQRARYLEGELGHWPEVVDLYEKAIAKNHWKAMHNLANLYRVGEPGSSSNPGIEKNTSKMLDLYERMVELKVPLGYYSWAVSAEHGKGMLRSERMASSYMFQAAQLGNPLAQVRIGQFFAYELPREKQDDEMAEQYYRCAGAQDNPDALLKTASFYDTAKHNYPRALFYYQRAASLGSTSAINALIGVFNDPPSASGNLGYRPSREIYEFYESLYEQVRANPELRFPNLTTEHPLPPHPVQGYDAEHPERRFEL